MDSSEQLTVPARFASHPAVEQAHPVDDIILMQPMVLYGDNMGSLFTSKSLLSQPDQNALTADITKFVGISEMT